MTLTRPRRDIIIGHFIPTNQSIWVIFFMIFNFTKIKLTNELRDTTLF